YANVYPDVTTGLQAFQHAGARLAIVTNKPFDFATDLLEHLALADYFDLVVGGDTCDHKKPNPEPLLHACRQLGACPADSLMVGDSINDAQAAQAAGMPVLLLPYGYSPHHNV